MENSLLTKSITKDDVTKTLEVKEAKNGFIIKISKSYYEENGMGEKEYKYDCDYWISKTNPFAKKENKKAEKEPKTISEAIKDLKF